MLLECSGPRECSRLVAAEVAVITIAVPEMSCEIWISKKCSKNACSLAWPDPIRPGAYRLEIISAGAYNLQSISAWAKRVWPRETRTRAELYKSLILAVPNISNILRSILKVKKRSRYLKLSRNGTDQSLQRLRNSSL